MKLERICPICNCNDAEKLYEINFAKSKNEFISECYDIVSCYNCGFILIIQNGHKKIMINIIAILINIPIILL